MFESLIHSLDAIIWEADLDTLQIRFVSQQAERILGYPVEHWLSKPGFWLAHIHPDDVTQIISSCRQLKADSPPLHLEYRMYRVDGRYIWLRDHIVVKHEEGQPLLLHGIKIDITLHKQADAIQQERTTVLQEFARIVSATLDHRQVLQQSLIQLKRVLAFDSASIYLNPGNEQSEFVAGIGYEDDVMTTHDAQRLLKNSPILSRLSQDLTPIISADVRTLEDWIWIVGAEHVRSFMAVPLIGHNQMMLGALMVDNKEVGFFTLADLQMVQSLAQHMAIAIENAWLYESVQQELAEKAVLLEAGTAVSSSLDLRTILTQLAQAMGQALDVTSVYICDWNPYDQTTTVLAEYYSQTASEKEKISDLGHTYHILHDFGTAMDWLSRHEITFEHQDSQNLSALEQEHLEQYGARSILSIPLIVRSKAVGYIELWESRYRREFTVRERAIGQGIAQHAAIALANAQLFTAEAQRRNEAEILKTLTIHLTSTLELDEVLWRVIEAIRQHITDVHSCGISLLEDNKQALRMLVAWAERPEFEFAPVGDMVAIDKTIHSRIVLESCVPLAIGDVWREEPLNERGDIFRNNGLRSILYVPLLIHYKPIGILHLNFWHEPRYFQPEEISFCQSVANQAAISIENARLFAKERRSAEELSLLHEIAMVTAVSLDIDSLLHLTTDLIVKKVYPHAFGFTLIDPETNLMQTHPSFHGVPDTFHKIHIPAKSIAGHVVATGEPYLCGNVLQEPLYFPGNNQTRSRIAVPLSVDDHIIGTINAASAQFNAFNNHDLRFLSTLASQVALAIERTRLYKTLQKQADDLARQVDKRTAELQEEHDRTTAILESAGEGIMLLDTKANIVYANPAMTQQSGYSHSALLEKTATIWASAQTPENVYQELWQALQNGRSWSGELISQRQDGASYDINLILSSLYDAQNQLTGFVAVQSDISRLKEIERLKTQFVSNVSHELRTPLTNIKMYLTLLERGKVEKRDHYLHILKYETERLERLIQDLLDLSRLDTAQNLDLTAVTNITTSLQTLYSSYVGKAKNKGINLTETISTQLPPIHINAHHFEQLVNNLLGNALAYTPAQGHITFQITNNGKLVQIQISNSGPGISAADLPHIFDRFYRGKMARELTIPGTGLGLAICKEIVERYNGRIEVQSEPYRLTTATVWLPIAQSKTKIPDS